MSGGFAVIGGNNGGSGLREKYEAMDKYVVETVGLEKPKTVIGVVSAIVDLGRQPLRDAEYALSGDDIGLSVEELMEKHAELVTSRGVYFAEGYNGDKQEYEIMRKVPQKPEQCVAIAIDFPSKVIDKAPFFDLESNPAPLRIWYGGKTWNKESQEMIIQNLTNLRQRPITDGGKDWSLNPKSLLHKMAVASELVADDKVAFHPSRLDQLLGKAFLFKTQVTFEAGKGSNQGRKFYKEKVTFVGALMDGQETPVLDRLNLVMMGNENNSEQAVKEIPAHIVNTLSRSLDFKNSALEKQLALLEVSKGDNGGGSGVDGDSGEDSGENYKESVAPASGSTDW